MNKWKTKRQNLSVGDVVLLKVSNDLNHRLITRTLLLELDTNGKICLCGLKI